jgi:hypothetical protein
VGSLSAGDADVDGGAFGSSAFGALEPPHPRRRRERERDREARMDAS